MKKWRHLIDLLNERELGSYRRLERQIRNTLVEQEMTYVNLNQRAQQVRAQEDESKKERE